MLCAVRIQSALQLALFAFATGVAFAQSPAPAPVTTAGAEVAGVKYVSPDHLPSLANAPKHYVPPTGFAGYDWGTPRNKVTRLPAQPAGLWAAWTHGALVGEPLVCSGYSLAGGIGGCTVADFMRAQ